MTPYKSLQLVVVSAFVFCLLGAVLGFCVATFFPEYYEAAFLARDSPQFRPVPIGIGLGATQGAGTGVVAGLALVFVFLWKEARKTAIDTARPEQSTTTQLTKGMMTVTLALLFGGSTYVAYLAGGVVGQVRLYGRLNSTQLERLRDVICEDAYPLVEADRSKRYVYLTGEVPSDDALATLTRQLTEEFGRTEAERMTKAISVKP